VSERDSLSASWHPTRCYLLSVPHISSSTLRLLLLLLLQLLLYLAAQTQFI